MFVHVQSWNWKHSVKDHTLQSVQRSSMLACCCHCQVSKLPAHLHCNLITISTLLLLEPWVTTIVSDKLSIRQHCRTRCVKTCCNQLSCTLRSIHIMLCTQNTLQTNYLNRYQQFTQPFVCDDAARTSQHRLWRENPRPQNDMGPAAMYRAVLITKLHKIRQLLNFPIDTCPYSDAFDISIVLQHFTSNITAVERPNYTKR